MRSIMMVGALLVALPAMAQLEVTVTQGVERRFPTAIVPFGWQGQGPTAPFDVAALVQRDLGNSGYFDPMDRRDMVSRPTDSAEINFQDWQIVDVDIVLVGRVIQNGADDYTVRFQLFDVTRAQQLLGFTVNTTGDGMRSTSHQIADMVFEEMIGVRGIFDTRIAYIAEERISPTNRTFRLIVADADGENAATIAESDQPLMSPTFSPDGRRIAYVSFEGNQSAIYVQTLRTGTRQRVSSRAGINGAPAFSPDGRVLALTLSLNDGNLDVYTLDLTNQVLRRITTHAAIDTGPAWSADGRSLYFTSDRAGSPQLYRVDAEPGNRADRVTYEGTYNTDPRVSPDGESIVLIHRNQGRDRVALFTPETRYLNILSQGQLDESPSFAPNGEMIIYATRDGGQGVLAAVSKDGRVQQQIASVGGDVREPVWSPYSRP